MTVLVVDEVLLVVLLLLDEELGAADVVDSDVLECGGDLKWAVDR